MSIIKFGIPIIPIAGDTISFDLQTIDPGVSIKDPVFLDSIGTWNKATNTTPEPIGVFEGAGKVVLRDKLVSTGFIVGLNYYLADTGGLTTTITNIKIGQALSSTELLVDIDIPNIIFDKSGYSVGGFVLPSTQISSIEKLNFNTENNAVILSTLTTTKFFISGCNSDISGYISGGNGNISSIEKLIFSDDTAASLISTLEQGKGDTESFESQSFGYTVGGLAGIVVVSNITKLIFGNDSTGQLLKKLVRQRRQHSGFNSSSFGYSVAGFDDSVNADISQIENLNFSNEATTAIVSVISSATRGGVGLESKTSGYSASGTPLFGSTISKLIFSTDSVSDIISTTNIENAGSGSNKKEAGYIAGGLKTGLTVNVSSIQRLDFINDVVTTLLTNLNQEQRHQAGFED